MRKKLLLSLLAAVCCMSMWAQTGPADNEIWYTTSNGEAVSDWYFDDEYTGLTFKSNTYTDGKGVVAFEENLTQIPCELFGYCEELTSVTIPACVEKIGPSAFWESESLETVTFAEGSKLTEIGDRAFNVCSALASITLPEGLESIGEAAFASSGLSSIVIPSTVTFIGEQAFGGAGSAEGSVTFADGSAYEVVNEAAFCYSNFGTIILPESITAIETSAFDDCENLKSLTFAGESKLTTLGDFAISGCTSLSSWVIPASVTKIGQDAFCMTGTADGCLTFAEGSKYTGEGDTRAFAQAYFGTIVLPESMTTLGACSFITYPLRHDTPCKSIIIPASVKSIGGSSFAGCAKLEEIIIFCTTPPTLEAPGTFDSPTFEGIPTNPKPVLVVPRGCKSAYENAEDTKWKEYFTIKEGEPLDVTEVGWASFYTGDALDIPSCAKVYYASAASGSTLTLTEITGTIPAATAVIVQIPAGTLFPVSESTSTPAITGNLLKGTLTDITRTEEVYVLSPASSKESPVFQNYTGNTLGAGKAYILKSDLDPTASNMLRFVFGEATHIEAVSADTNADAPMYNMAGQRVSDDYRGLVIKNGKKMWNN